MDSTDALVEAAAKKLEGLKTATERPPLTVEIAWEVCNKVGGIHTVIKTKVPQTVKQLGSNYMLIGPLTDAGMTDVEEIIPEAEDMKRTLEAMRSRGVNLVYGRWLIDGAPKVLLVDCQKARENLLEWKKDLFDKTRIGCPWEDEESNNAIAFGYLVAWFLGEYLHQSGGRHLVAHFHEWLAGIGLVITRIRGLPVSTVFTTHATLLGRYLCADTKCDFYNNLPFFDVDKEAGDRQIYHRYCIERAATHSAHVFTTVSRITAYEAENLLKRPVDTITPNGLNVVKFSALHEFQNRHAIAKAKIHKFVTGHFYGHFDFDLDKTIYFFTAGRYEFTNKGADLYLESLARLNHMLQQAGSDITVVAFIIMPTKTNSFNLEALRGQAVYKHMADTVSEIQHKIGRKMLDSLAKGNMPTIEDLVDKVDVVNMKRCLKAADKSGLPPVVTHNVVESEKDEVLSCVRRIHLFNNHHDRVKVIFHPEFLSSSSPLLPMDYEEFVRGCHLGVFASYYEPWGYTPAECTVMGVPSMTSDLSGFGLFVRDHVEDPSSYGIYVVDRRYKSPEESIRQMTEHMFDFCNLSRRQRINLRNRTERLSDLLGWSSLEEYYWIARRLALHRQHPSIYPDPNVASKDDFKMRASACNSPKMPRLNPNPENDSTPMDQLSLE